MIKRFGLTLLLSAALPLAAQAQINSISDLLEKVRTDNAAQAQKRSDLPELTQLARILSPAVVNISTAQTIEVNTDDVPAFPKGSPLERFNDFFGGGGSQNGRVSKSLGSGFVVDADGYIVTNNHVIEDADLIEVTFPNGDTYEAELLGRDPATDIALLKIEAGKPMPFVKFGDSDNAEVGEWVMAIGNPFGYSGSVAAGIISARNRDISHGSYDDFIQTDVAINKGNSGGPLFNMDGDVIGVNTAILSPTGYSVGISFSVPAELASSVVDQLREFGGMIAESKIDETLEVSYIRKRKKKTAKVVIERLKEQVTEEEKERRKQAEADADRVAYGIAIEALTDETRKKYRVGDEVKGVRVVKVEKRAEASGKILTGDIIEEVGFEVVTSPKEFEEAMDAAKKFDAPVTLLINRGGNYIFYALSV